jgi:hypothetical protein
MRSNGQAFKARRQERVERVVPNALALAWHRLPEKAIHLPFFLIQNFQVSDLEPIPAAALGRDDWKPANRD